MTDDEIRAHMLATVLRVRPSSRRWYTAPSLWDASQMAPAP